MASALSLLVKRSVLGAIFKIGPRVSLSLLTSTLFFGEVLLPALEGVGGEGLAFDLFLDFVGRLLLAEAVADVASVAQGADEVLEMVVRTFPFFNPDHAIEDVQRGGALIEDLPDYRFSLYVTNIDLPLDQQRAEARLRPRRLLPARLLGYGSLLPLHHGGLQPDESVQAF